MRDAYPYMTPCANIIHSFVSLLSKFYDFWEVIGAVIFTLRFDWVYFDRYGVKFSEIIEKSMNSGDAVCGVKRKRAARYFGWWE